MTIKFIKKPLQSVALDCKQALREMAEGKETPLYLVKLFSKQEYRVLKADFNTSNGWPRLLLKAEEGVEFWTHFGERENHKYFPEWRAVGKT